MLLSIFFTLFVYIMSIAFMWQYFDTSYITWQFLLKTLAITLLSWMPLHLLKCLIMRLDPTEQYKILKQHK